MALGSRTCRVMYFHLPTLAPKRPARSKRNRLLFIRGTANSSTMREPTNQNRQRELSALRSWPTWWRVARRRNICTSKSTGEWYVLPEQWIPCRRRRGGGGRRKFRQGTKPKRPVYFRLIKGTKRRGVGNRVKNGIGITGIRWIKSGKEKWLDGITYKECMKKFSFFSFLSCFYSLAVSSYLIFILYVYLKRINLAINIICSRLY